MICDFSEMIGDDDAILDDRDLPQVQLQNDNVQASDTKSNEVTSAFANRPIDNILESLYKMQVERSEELKHALHVFTHETSFGDKKYDYCRLKLMAHRYLEQKIKESHFKARNLRRGQTCNRSSVHRKKQKENAKQMPKTTPREDMVR